MNRPTRYYDGADRPSLGHSCLALEREARRARRRAAQMIIAIAAVWSAVGFAACLAWLHSPGPVWLASLAAHWLNIGPYAY
jgi:hypothetical protein